MSRPLRNRIRSPGLRAAFSAGLPKCTGNKKGFSWWTPARRAGVPAPWLLCARLCPGPPPRAGYLLQVDYLGGLEQFTRHSDASALLAVETQV